MDAGIPNCYGCFAPFPGFQIWLVHRLQSVGLVSGIMHSTYGWLTCEILHFFGLSVLLGTIGMFDLRVLGVAKRIPISALHRVAPWGIVGFFINTITGLMFLVTYPNLYVYQPPFIAKMMFMTLAAINALIFNLVVLRRVDALAPGEDAPLTAKIMCGASLCLWVGVIFAGRLLAFYKPLWGGPPP